MLTKEEQVMKEKEEFEKLGVGIMLSKEEYDILEKEIHLVDMSMNNFYGKIVSFKNVLSIDNALDWIKSDIFDKEIMVITKSFKDIKTKIEERFKMLKREEREELEKQVLKISDIISNMNYVLRSTRNTIVSNDELKENDLERVDLNLSQLEKESNIVGEELQELTTMLWGLTVDGEWVSGSEKKRTTLEMMKPVDACLFLQAKMNDYIERIKDLYLIDELEYKIYFEVKREDGTHRIQLDNKRII